MLVDDVFRLASGMSCVVRERLTLLLAPKSPSVVDWGHQSSSYIDSYSNVPTEESSDSVSVPVETNGEVGGSREKQLSLPSSESLTLKQSEEVKIVRSEFQFQPRERAVPSTSIGRAFGFGFLGAKLLFGTAVDSVTKTVMGGKKWHFSMLAS